MRTVERYFLVYRSNRIKMRTVSRLNQIILFFSFHHSISDNCHIPANHLKLISCGHVIADNQSLNDQSVRHNSQVMVICLTEGEIDAKRQEEQASRLARTKDAAQALANRKEGTVLRNLLWMSIRIRSCKKE